MLWVILILVHTQLFEILIHIWIENTFFFKDCSCTFVFCNGMSIEFFLIVHKWLRQIKIFIHRLFAIIFNRHLNIFVIFFGNFKEWFREFCTQTSHNFHDGFRFKHRINRFVTLSNRRLNTTIRNDRVCSL